MLVGRAFECSRIDRLIGDAAAGRSGTLVLSGEPGIGKSALCRWAGERAESMRIITATGVAAEEDLCFAGLSELCADDYDRIPRLPEPQGRALEDALTGGDAPAGERFAVGAALLSLLGLASDASPLLVVVDDAQWLDAASADALLFATRRLRSERVAVLIATRPGTAFDERGTGLDQLPLGPLASEDARALLVTVHPEIAPEVAERLVQSMGGNPLALLEVPHTLAAAQLAGWRPIDHPLPVGPTLERALSQRTAALPARTQRALLILAASGGERLQPVLDALTALGYDRQDLEPAELAGVVRIVGPRIEFRHPLLRAAIYHAAHGPARRAAHAALANVSEGEAHAWQLAHATLGEDEPTAALLEQAGRAARRRGAPAAAAHALERAARLSPASEARAQRLIEAAHDANLAGRPAMAASLLDEALELTNDPVARAAAQHLQGRMLMFGGHADAAHQLLRSAARAIRDIDPARSGAILADAALECVPAAKVEAAVSVAREACELAPPSDPFARSILACALGMSGRRRDALALLDQCLPELQLVDALDEGREIVANAAQTCTWLGRTDEAARLLDRLIVDAREASTPAALPYPLIFRAELNLRLGHWTVTAAQAQEVLELSQALRQDVSTVMALCVLGRLAAATGDELRCRQFTSQGLALVDRYGIELGRIHLHASLGLLELGLGHTDQAIEHLEFVRDTTRAIALAEPNIIQWQGDLIEALIHAGNADAATDALTELQEQAHTTDSQWALATAARCRGLLGSVDHAEECFADALTRLEPLHLPFETARTHLSRGERLRRAGRRTAAREALTHALGHFDQLGATVWSDRTRTELAACGARPRRRGRVAEPEQLTAHELQVAMLVAGGATNRQAAAALFLSPKTIEFHLAHIYRKLGVHSRTQLAATAARNGWLDHADNVLVHRPDVNNEGPFVV